jgi:uncharacterized membrane protein
MTRAPRSLEGQQRLIAGLLEYGTWIAAAVIGASLLIGLSGHDGLIVEKAGVGLFILLPVARVALMFVLFVHARDRTYAAISALVLAIIAAGVAAGL